MSGSGICWAICKSAPHPRQPRQHPTTQFFTGRMPFLPPNEQRQSTEGKHTTGSRNIKPEVVFIVQKVTRYASFCLIMGLFNEEVPAFARLWPVRFRVRVSFTTGAVWSAILATAGLLVWYPRNAVGKYNINFFLKNSWKSLKYTRLNERFVLCMDLMQVEIGDIL